MKYARVEIERRFLLARPPDRLPADYRRIRDWYLEGTRLRLRRIEDPQGAVLALKLGQKYGGGLSTTIANLYLTGADDDLPRTLGGRPTAKHPQPDPHAEPTVRVDVF